MTIEEHENEKNKEILSAGRALFIAAFTVIAGSAATGWLLYALHLKL